MGPQRLLGIPIQVPAAGERVFTIDLRPLYPILTAAAFHSMYCTSVILICPAQTWCGAQKGGSTKVSLSALLFYGSATLAVVFLIWVLFKLAQEARH